MSAIEYGSYYWCVVLQGKEDNKPGESIYLHADDIAIGPTGALTFRSAGRRPAGSEPKLQNARQQEDKEPNEDGKGQQDDKNSGMIYIAFAPGTWKVVYAAKLQDGAPASVEHWNSASRSEGVAAVVPPDSGAVGFLHRE
jgi:hypothetical protein